MIDLMANLNLTAEQATVLQTYTDARRLMAANQLTEAIELFKRVATLQPDWEHGGVHHDLGQCYEDIGDHQQADASYKESLRYEPFNPYYLSSYASFLFLRRDWEAAFDAYLRHLRVERRHGESTHSRESLETVERIGRELGLTVEQVRSRIEAAS